MSANPYAPPKADVDDVAVREASPPLWNPSAAAKWSLLFSPVFGAILHMKNWQALGEPEKAAQSKMWAWGSVAFFVLMAVLGGVMPDSKALDLASRGAGLGLLVAWYTLNAKAQVAHVAAHFGTTYPRRGWWQPLLYALLCFFALVGVIVLISLAMGEGEV